MNSGEGGLGNLLVSQEDNIAILMSVLEIDHQYISTAWLSTALHCLG